MGELVKLTIEGGIATVTLDSPSNRNALSSVLVRELLDSIGQANEDPNARVIVLTHTGNTFCAGADLKEAVGNDPASAADTRVRWMIDILRGIVGSPKPVVAVIDGNVRAGGMGIVGACDFVFAGQQSTFALTEVRIGVVVFMISLTLKARMTSRAWTRYVLTGEKFDSRTAEQIGLITAAVDDPQTEAKKICDELRQGGPIALAEAKKLVNGPILADIDSTAEELAQKSASFFGSPESIEGITAFFQKRPPSWAQ
jgi:enoyl-CoA hydratase